MTTVIFITCILLAVFFTMWIALKACYKEVISGFTVIAWALSITGLITRFAGIW